MKEIRLRILFGGGEELCFSAWFQLDWLMAVGVCDWSVLTTVLGTNKLVPRGFWSLSCLVLADGVTAERHEAITITARQHSQQRRMCRNSCHNAI